MPVEIGKTYGRLTVLYKSDTPYISPKGRKQSKYHVICSCDKHTEFDVIGRSLVTGNTKSCGCLNEERKEEFLKNGEKTRFKVKDGAKNIYDLSGEYGIGYTYDTNEPFYFDLEDYEKIKPYLWKFKDSGYVISIQNQKTIYLHRLVMDCIDSKKDVDHIFHDLKDCRKSQLRICDHYQNLISSKTYSNNTSGRKGVIWNKERNKWEASITCNKKTYYLGRFDKFEDAVLARENAEKKYHKEYHYNG